STPQLLNSSTPQLMTRILITGASKGIGFETALALCRQEYNVLALSRDEEGLSQLQTAAEGASGSLDTLRYDLMQPDTASLLEWINRQGGLDVLINNAGLLLNKPFAELTMADWQESFSVNLFGAVSLIQTVMPFLQVSATAHIVNIGSMGGFQGSSKFPGLSAYSASKAALANLTECLAEELKDSGISVNCLALGAVQTEMLAMAFPGYQAPVNKEDMGSFVAWFATQGGRFFNGKILPVSVSTP
ncbi:MAG: SDR family oxidoreductase, partial [Saprospiraceae bacterium]|nr:SDR family oxidoreductase [Saprospiraceae bacterium]MDZ4705346.1 SDR family oxidoreductase [Saprospiraceae bacterium]